MIHLPPTAVIKPDVPFSPGVDQGVKAWLLMRQAVRDSKSRGRNVRTIPCDIPYKYHQYWIDVLFSMNPSEISEVIKMKGREPAYWTPIIDESRKTMQLNDFEQLLQDINEETGPTIIKIALEHRSMVFITKVVELKINLEMRIGPLQRTPLMLACMHGDLRKMTYLIEQGVRINRQDKNGLTALHLSMKPVSMFHSLEIPTKLIDNHAKVNRVDRNHRTALHYACIISSLPLVELLLENNADMSLKDIHSKLPIDYTNDMEIHQEFGKYALIRARRQQFIKMNSLIVARKFVADIFQAAQPRCSECKRTLSKCALLKKENYKFWLYAHARLRNEKYNVKKVATSYIPFEKMLTANQEQDPNQGQSDSKLNVQETKLT